MRLEDRCTQFLRYFPSAHLKTCTLREVYRRHNIRKKNLRWTKKAKDHDPEADRKWLATVKRKLTRAKNEGRRVIFCDETMISRKTIKPTEWARKNENMTVDEAKLNEPTLAILASISKEKGLEHYRIFEKSVNTTKFI